MVGVPATAEGDSRHPPEQYRFFLERLGLREILSYDDDYPDRSDVARLHVMVFDSTDVDELRPIEVVESLLWDDRKVNTYKFALIRAIVHLASHRPNLARWEGSGRVSVPIDAVTDLWIRYYWPLVGDDSEPSILQGHKGQKADMAFRQSLRELRCYWQSLGGLAAFSAALQKNRLPQEAQSLLAATRRSVRTAVQQPVRFAGNDRTGKQMFSYESERIHLPESIWREAALLGRWIEDSVMIRWAEFSTSLKNQHADVTAEMVLARLVRNYEGERDTSLAQDAYQVHAQRKALQCVWTGVLLSKFDVDHAIPWSLWRSNDLWNLLPAHPRVNNEKRARIPSRLRVEARRDAIIGSWEILYQAEPAMFMTQARAFVGPNAESDFTRSMRSQLYGTFKDALEYTAVNRGVERW